jgi:hypothetical protein
MTLLLAWWLLITFSGALVVENGADDAAVLLEDDRVLAPHVGGGQDQAPVVRQDVRQGSSRNINQSIKLPNYKLINQSNLYLFFPFFYYTFGSDVHQGSSSKTIKLQTIN